MWCVCICSSVDVHIAVGSTNPVKIDCVRRGFLAAFQPYTQLYHIHLQEDKDLHMLSTKEKEQQSTPSVEKYIESIIDLTRAHTTTSSTSTTSTTSSTTTSSPVEYTIYVRFHGVSAQSGVADQPFSTSETLLGALNRARSSSSLLANADLWIGVEGGVRLADHIAPPSTTWSTQQEQKAVQEDARENDDSLQAKVPTLDQIYKQNGMTNPHASTHTSKLEQVLTQEVPELEAYAWIVILSRSGQIGKSCTSTFTLPPRVSRLLLKGVELGHADDRIFGRENSKQGNGACGILTLDVITRTTYYEQAVVFALIPMLQQRLFPFDFEPL